MCHSDGAYTSPHFGRKVNDVWHRSGECTIQRDASQESEACYNSRHKGGMQRDPSLGQRIASDSPSEGTRFRQSRQSHSEHPGVSDRDWSCCWCNTQWTLRSSEIRWVLGRAWWVACRVLRLYSSVSWLAILRTLQGDFTFELSWRAGWWLSIMQGDMAEAEGIVRGQIAITRKKGRQTMLGGCFM
jgi:hypothetical protein